MPRVVQGGRGGGRGGGGGRGKGRGGAKKGRQAGNKRNPAKNTTSKVVFDDSDDDDENNENCALTKKKYKKKGKVETGLLDQAAREVIRAKKANGNRVPHRLLEEKIDELNDMGGVSMTFYKVSLQDRIRA